MIHGYHVILPVYGFWLPNDPRGSWSDFVGAWELARFGKARPTAERRSLRDLTEAERQQRDAARAALKYPPVQLTGLQARAVGRGFAQQIRNSRYTVWACAIMPEHTHLVIARHSYAVEQIANLLKGAATRQLVEEGRHPMAAFAEPGQRPPRLWAERAWKIYLDSDKAIENAIAYVQNNPLEEDWPAQHWKFVTPYTGLSAGGWTTYHV
jgi:REP element-mobilizing transposase RayT